MKTSEKNAPARVMILTGANNGIGLASRLPWVILFSRILLFAGVQAVFAVAYFLAGSSQPWVDASGWSLSVVAIANVIVLAALVRIFRAEGGSYRDLFRLDRRHVKADLLVLLLVTVLMAPVSYLPNVLLARWLFGQPEATLELLIRPLPMWAVTLNLIAFPVTQGLVELASYFGYVMPRFKAQGMNTALAVIIPSLMLALQHVAVPLLFDARFLVWRGLMFVPFALLVGTVLNWRPRLLPYLAVIHVLMDFSFAMMFLEAA